MDQNGGGFSSLGTFGGGGRAFGRMSQWEMQANAMQSNIRRMEQELQDLQARYATTSVQTNNPTMLTGMQSAIKSLEMQIQQARQGAQQWLSMQAMKQQQRSQMPGAGSVGVGGRGGDPNQQMQNYSQQIGMLSNMFAPSGGSSPYGRY